MTRSVSQDGLRRYWQAIAATATVAVWDPWTLNNVLCHHVNIGPDREAARTHAKHCLHL
jgi:hypothetical protein